MQPHNSHCSSLKLWWLLQSIFLASPSLTGSFFALAAHDFGSCPIECRHGSCILESPGHHRCECEAGFSGPACDIPYATCPDGRECYNGSTCKRINKAQDGSNKTATDTYEYHCDCSAAYKMSDFVGQQCENEKIAVCEAEATSNPTAFCTNGGQCRNIVMFGENHPGCHCRMEFEGTRCQYWRGTAPPEDLQPYIRTMTEPSGSAVEKMTAAMIVVVVLSVIAFLGFMIIKIKMARERNEYIAARRESETTTQVITDEDGEEVYII